VGQVLRSVDAKDGLSLGRKVSDLRRIVTAIKKHSRPPLSVCEAIINNQLFDRTVHEFFSGLPQEEKHYWLSSLYALLMPGDRRRQLAAYFTPPHLVDYAIDLLVDAGVKLGTHRILDPASGGAAFLVPLAIRIAKAARRRGATAQEILETVRRTLSGIEIDANLAKLSRVLLADCLTSEANKTGLPIFDNITRADTLKLDIPANEFDAVIGNPPYGRVFRPTKALQEQFASVIASGYVNLYSLFIAQSIRSVRPGGVVCLIVPTSFIGGPNFAALRKYILQQTRVIRIDPIDKRTDVFLDVMYDLCVLVLEKRNGNKSIERAVSSLVLADQPPRQLGRIDLPKFPEERVWALPNGQDDSLFQSGLRTLADYGYVTKTGYFVWNREKGRYRTGKTLRKTEVPLFWAHNIKPNRNCNPSHSKVGGKTGFVTIEVGNPAIINSDAVVLQRTSNRRQERRLVAGVIRQRDVPGRRGYVTENHTILLLPDATRKRRIPLSQLCRLLNSAAVDARFRRISGTVSVSTKALRVLPLPDPVKLRAAFAEPGTDDERVEKAYAQSVLTNEKSQPGSCGV
jgi:adenine-specific DNA-methyltransferase